ncbi:Sodium- and chloride-dependent betaine transporter BGT-1 [Takifugu flavidus]|uniref:Sodium-and chloride-dependent betaine transporter BGT-1 n=1 Tax=Takifugu flavidus TaxID=433684 RepID=A0A5C6NTP1_9TELE|nr:Sodium- and chloride-dependent betaine transporter BGT-1 [Takifugu flavidus]
MFEGVFLLPYCFFTVLCGLPLFLLETVMGQFTQEGVVTCWTKICPLAQGTGYFIIIIQIYFRVYTIVLAWIVFYLINSFRGTLPWATCNNPWNTGEYITEVKPIQHIFQHNIDQLESYKQNLKPSIHPSIHPSILYRLSGVGSRGQQPKKRSPDFPLPSYFFQLVRGDPQAFPDHTLHCLYSNSEELGTVRWELLLCLLACWIACYFCIWKGVQSTGKVVYFTAIFPYVMMAILLIRGLMLPGALQGLVFYLYPDVSRLADLQVWMDACSQVLFSYGVSAGTLITFGSYNKLKNNCCRDCLWLSVLNASTSFVAGFVVFSTLGFMAQAQGVPIDMVAESGPGLAFIAFPQAIAMMPLPQLWAVCFFFMLLLLGIDTMFAGLEALISAMIDLFPGEMRRPWRREAGLLIFCCTCFIVQICLTTEGGVYLFELVDYYGCSGTCILFGSLIQCLAVGWAFGAEQMCNAVEEITGQRPWLLYKLCWRYFTPLLSLVSCTKQESD